MLSYLGTGILHVIISVGHLAQCLLQLIPLLNLFEYNMENKINHSSNKYLLNTYHVPCPVLVAMGIQRLRQNVRRKGVNNTVKGEASSRFRVQHQQRCRGGIGQDGFVEKQSSPVRLEQGDWLPRGLVEPQLGGEKGWKQCSSNTFVWLSWHEGQFGAIQNPLQHRKVPGSLLYCPIFMLEEGVWVRSNHLESTGH